ncbi:hypothetical protein [Streptomyces sp. bgisy027]|uniref:hypothetical protein n=1 Tax=unclassified Streptomyces TaxID=2593676 RepID=UPI003D73BBA2
MLTVVTLLVSLQLIAAWTPGASTHFPHTAYTSVPTSPALSTSLVVDEYLTCSDDEQITEPPP